MRLPVIGNISTKDGATNKNARLTNMLAEQKKNGTTLATVRPGLNIVSQTTGEGNGIACFNGEIVCLFGDQITAGMYHVAGSSSFSTTSDVFPKPLRAIIKLGSTWFAFPNHQEYDHATVGGIWYSTDLASWTEVTASRGYELWGKPFVVGSQIVLVAYYCTYDPEEDIDVAEYDDRYKIVITSSASISYTPLSDTSHRFFSPVLYKDGYYYGEAQSPGTPYYFARSSDLETITIGDAEPYNNHPLKTIYGGGKFWHSGTNYIQYSDDGLSWSSPVSLGATISGELVYANGKLNVFVLPNFIFKTDNGNSFDAYEVYTYVQYTSSYQGFFHNENSGKYYLYGSFLNGSPDYLLSLAVSDDAENWEDITPSGALMQSINCYVINGNSHVFGISEGESYPFNYGISVVSTTPTTYELSDISSLQNARVDFALIP